jgi:uncharacterized integral membrane protein (TIGR00697 family)
MAVSILLANVLNVKFIEVFGLFVPAGTLIFAMTFLISDMISEFWGKVEAQKAVWAGFVSSLLYLFLVQVTILWAPAPFSIEVSESFATLFNLLPRIMIGSMVAYLVVQHFDVWLYHELKKFTKDKHLWLRNNVSTVISQFLDSAIFFSIAFLGTSLFPNIGSLVVPVLSLWALKVGIAIVDTPFIYWLRSIVRKLG